MYHKWGVKTGFTFALQFFMLISDGLGGVTYDNHRIFLLAKSHGIWGTSNPAALNSIWIELMVRFGKKNPIKKYGCVQRLPKYSNVYKYWFLLYLKIWKHGLSAFFECTHHFLKISWKRAISSMLSFFQRIRFQSLGSKLDILLKSCWQFEKSSKVRSFYEDTRILISFKIVVIFAEIKTNSAKMTTFLKEMRSVQLSS